MSIPTCPFPCLQFARIVIKSPPGALAITARDRVASVLALPFATFLVCRLEFEVKLCRNCESSEQELRIQDANSNCEFKLRISSEISLRRVACAPTLRPGPPSLPRCAGLGRGWPAAPAGWWPLRAWSRGTGRGRRPGREWSNSAPTQQTRSSAQNTNGSGY